MAQAKKCDRCSEYYDNDRYVQVKRNEEGHLVPTGHTIIGIDIIKKDDHRLGIDQRLDLCADCIVKLYNFLDGKDRSDS